MILTSRRHKRSSRLSPARTAWTPRLEPLEDRRVLATFTVTNLLDAGAGSLRDAVDQANTTVGADIVDFQAGLAGIITLTTGELAITDDVQVTGAGATITVNGNNASRVFNVDDGDDVSPQLMVRIDELTVSGGNVVGNLVSAIGGGIRNTESLTILDTTITLNQGEFGGGVGNTNGGTLLIRDSFVRSNTALTRGGGVYNNDGGQVMIYSTSIATNSVGVANDSMYSTVGGGASNFGIGSLMSISGSTVTGNLATHDDTMYAASGLGGGVANDYYGTLNVSDTTLESNSADFGGASWHDDDAVSVFESSSMLTSNIVNERGGGIFAADGAMVTVQDSSISGNATTITGTGDAGAIMAQSGAYVLVDNSTISDNYAYDRGGAVYLSSFPASPADPLTRVTIRNDSTLSGNTAATDIGGAVNVGQFGVLLVEESTIENNSTGADGGAIASSAFGSLYTTYVTVLDSMITGNSAADDAGAVSVGSNARFRTDGTDFRNNYAYDRGGALYLSGFNNAYNNNYSTITDGTFYGNTAIDDGGAIHAASAVVLTIEDSQIVSNSAASRGGGLRFSFAGATPSTATVLNSNISGNTSSSIGGGIYNGQSFEMTLEDSTVDSNSSVGGSGGGVYSFPRAQPDGIGETETNIVRSTISGNSSAVDGGGVHSYNTSVSLDQSTVSGNYSGYYGGGVFLRQDTTYGPNYSVKIDGTTITANNGGGLYLTTYAATSLDNSIVAANTAFTGADIADMSGGIAPRYSLIGDNDGTALAEANPDAAGNIIGGPIGGTINPMLSPLGPYGGPTLTHLPMAGSPAIDAGDPSVMGGLDQRSYLRVADGRVDMGSVETNSVPVAACDFDADGDCDIDDLDALVMESAAGTNNTFFDLTNDDLVNEDDICEWLIIAGADPGNVGITGGNPFLKADFNLDGVVDGQDFIIWNGNKFSATGKWSMGDANGDGVTDGQDFIIWNGNKFMSSMLSATADDLVTAHMSDGQGFRRGLPAAETAELSEAGGEFRMRQLDAPAEGRRGTTAVMTPIAFAAQHLAADHAIREFQSLSLDAPSVAIRHAGPAARALATAVPSTDADHRDVTSDVEARKVSVDVVFAELSAEL